MILLGAPVKMWSFSGLRGRGSRAGLRSRRAHQEDDASTPLLSPEPGSTADATNVDEPSTFNDGSDLDNGKASEVTDFNITSTFSQLPNSIYTGAGGSPTSSYSNLNGAGIPEIGGSKAGFVVLIISLILVIVLCCIGIICLVRYSSYSRTRRLQKRRAFTKARLARMKRGVSDEYTTEEEDEKPENVERWKEERLGEYGYHDGKKSDLYEKLIGGEKSVIAWVMNSLRGFLGKNDNTSEDAKEISFRPARGRPHFKVHSTTGRGRGRGRAGFKVLDDGAHFVVDLESARAADPDTDAENDTDGIGGGRSAGFVGGKGKDKAMGSVRTTVVDAGHKKGFFDASEDAATHLSRRPTGRARSGTVSVYAGLGLGLGLANIPDTSLSSTRAVKDTKLKPSLSKRGHSQSLSDISSNPHIPLFTPLQRSASSIITTTISAGSVAEGSSASVYRTANSTTANTKSNHGDSGVFADMGADSDGEQDIGEDGSVDVAFGGNPSTTSLFPGAAGSKFKEAL